MKRFAVRPYPEAMESLSGYILRLGKLNGIYSLPETLSLLADHKNRWVRAGGWLHYRDMASVFEGLELRLGRPCNDIKESMMARNVIDWLIDSGRSIVDIRFSMPRVCASCIVDNEFIDWRWGLAVTGTCPKHHQPLISRCPHCKKALRWNVDLLKGCSSCRKSWNAMISAGDCSITEMEVDIWLAAQRPIEMNLSTLRDACSAIRIMARPFDSLHDRLRQVPNSREHTDVVRLAYSALCNEGMRKQWVSSCEIERNEVKHFGERTVLAPIFNLVERIDSSKITVPQRDSILSGLNDEKWTFTEHTDYVRTLSARCSNEKDIDGLRYIADYEGVGFALKISERDVDALVETGVLSPLHETQQTKGHRFDLRRLTNILPRLRQEPDENFISVRPDSKCLSPYLANYGRLVAAIYKGKLTGGVMEDRQDLGEVFVRQDQFLGWLQEELRAETQHPLPTPTVIDALGCSKQVVVMLVEQKLLRWAKRSFWTESVEGRSYCEYILREWRPAL